MSKSLAIIVDQASAIERMLVESGGEITPELEKILEVNKDELSQKVDAYAFIMDRSKHLEAFYKEEAKKFTQAAKAMENLREHLKFAIKEAVTALNAEEVVGNLKRFKLMEANPSLKIDPEKEEELKKLYPKVTITTEIDKEKLKADLAIGPVEGATLEKSKYVQAFNVSPKQLKAKGA